MDKIEDSFRSPPAVLITEDCKNVAVAFFWIIAKRVLPYTTVAKIQVDMIAWIKRGQFIPVRIHNFILIDIVALVYDRPDAHRQRFSRRHPTRPNQLPVIANIRNILDGAITRSPARSRSAYHA